VFKYLRTGTTYLNCFNIKEIGRGSGVTTLWTNEWNKIFTESMKGIKRVPGGWK
jgi:hypothetical protein